MTLTTELSRKDHILTAALRVFLEDGYEAATIARIGRASASSTGSIYHAFPGKAAIAQALWTRAISGWREATGQARQGAEATVRASVSGLITWAGAEPELYRFYEEIRLRATFDPAFGDVAEEIRLTHQAGARLYAGWLARGEVRPLNWPVAAALMIGPAHSYLHHGGAATPMAAQQFADAAWAAVKRGP